VCRQKDEGQGQGSGGGFLDFKPSKLGEYTKEKAQGRCNLTETSDLDAQVHEGSLLLIPEII